MNMPKAVLAIFVLFLNMAPCEDALQVDGCTESVHFHDSQEEEQSGQEDACTPFCACACCGVPLNEVEQMVAFTDMPVEKEHEWNICLLLSPSFDIWQPPKI